MAVNTKKLSGKKLTRALDQIIRDIFKLKYKSPQCFVCDRYSDWFSPKKNPYGIQVGHYISRTRTVLRWDLKNLYPQCSSCNRTHNEAPAAFSLAIVTKIGQHRLDYLNNKVVEQKRNGGKSMTTLQKRQILEELTLLKEKLES